jgi:hypothetical protein
VRRDEAAKRGVRAPRPGVDCEEIGTQQGVGDDEAVDPPVEGRRQRRGEAGDEQHRPQQHRAEGAVVGVKEVGDVGVRRPRPPHGDEQAGEGQRAAHRQMAMKPRGQLGHGDDEDQVEEQLGPRRVALDPRAIRLLQAQARGAAPGQAQGRDRSRAVAAHRDRAGQSLRFTPTPLKNV